MGELQILKDDDDDDATIEDIDSGAIDDNDDDDDLAMLRSYADVLEDAENKYDEEENVEVQKRNKSTTASQLRQNVRSCGRQGRANRDRAKQNRAKCGKPIVNLRSNGAYGDASFP